MAEPLGIEIEVLEAEPQRAVSAEALEHSAFAPTARARSRPSWWCRWTPASGIVNDIPALGASIEASGHGALFMVDAIASLGSMPFEMDDWGVDIAVAGAQKGLMMTPGLSFVAAREKALAAHANAGLRTRYWDWTVREGELHYMKYCGTPPVHLLFGLRKSPRHALRGRAGGRPSAATSCWPARPRLRSSAWSHGGALAFNVPEPAERSPTVTTILMDDPALSRLLDWCYEVCNVSLGIGLGPLSGHAFRIAHMGHVNAPMDARHPPAPSRPASPRSTFPTARAASSAAIDYLGARLKA